MTRQGSVGEPPVHYELTRAQLVFSGVSIAAAVLLLAAFGVRIVTHVDVGQWWVPAAFIAGIAAADFGSGLVHWGADTWGRDDAPLIGHRLLVPFRVHHINPDDFIRRRFMDTNGDVAFIAALVLAGLRRPAGTCRARGPSRAAVRHRVLHHDRLVQQASPGHRLEALRGASATPVSRRRACVVYRGLSFSSARRSSSVSASRAVRRPSRAGTSGRYLAARPRQIQVQPGPAAPERDADLYPG